MQSMKPPEGKLSSNIIISLISSVSRSLFLICPAFVQNVSEAVLPAAYSVEHLSEMIRLTRSNPIFCSSLVSIYFLFSSKTFSRIILTCKITKIIRDIGLSRKYFSYFQYISSPLLPSIVILLLFSSVFLPQIGRSGGHTHHDVLIIHEIEPSGGESMHDSQLVHPNGPFSGETNII